MYPDAQLTRSGTTNGVWPGACREMLWEQHEEDTVDGVRAKSCDLGCPLELAGMRDLRPPAVCSSSAVRLLGISLHFALCPPKSQPCFCQALRWLVPILFLLTVQPWIISFHLSLHPKWGSCCFCSWVMCIKTGVKDAI